MNNSIFREKSLKKMTSPEELDIYMKVTAPSMWIVLATVVFLLAAVIFWSITGRIEKNIQVNGEIVTETVAPISLLVE